MVDGPPGGASHLPSDARLDGLCDQLRPGNGRVNERRTVGPLELLAFEDARERPADVSRPPAVGLSPMSLRKNGCFVLFSAPSIAWSYGKVGATKSNRVRAAQKEAASYPRRP